MDAPSTFKEAIDKQLFAEAEEMILRGDNILESKYNFKLADAYPTIIRKDAYSIFNALVAHKHVELDIFEYDSFKDTLFLHLAKITTNSDAAIVFLNNFVPQVDNLNDSLEDQTWLSLAFTQNAHPTVIQTLIDNGCDLSYINNAEQNMLHQIIKTRAISDENRLAYIQICIDNGVNVSKKDKTGNTPIHLAITNNKGNCIPILVENGADPNIPNNEGKTAYYLVSVEQRNWDLCNLLSEHYPIDLNAETGLKSTILYEYLKQCHGATLSASDNAFISYFAENGADPMAPNESTYGQIETAADLIIKKDFPLFEAFFGLFTLDAQATDDHGNTLLHKVCAIDLNFDANKAKDLYRKVKFLLEKGADASRTNNNDKTAVILASDDNLKEKTVALLLKQ